MAQADKVSKALKDLSQHQKLLAPFDMRKAFAGKGDRFAEFSAAQDDLLLDFSKCAVTGKTMKLLLALAKAADVASKRDAMFAGAIINTTEGRAVLHTALRNQSKSPVMVGGKDVMPEVRGVLAAMATFAESVRASEITDVVNIGIGGSDLGPAMTTLALAPYHDGPRLHYVSNVDGAHIADTLKTLNPATTLFLIASKTFTTIETMTNAKTARALDRGEAGRGVGAVAFRGDFDGPRQGGGLRHQPGTDFRLLGLGWRALFHLVGHRPAADDCHWSQSFQALPRRRLCDG